MKKRGTAYWLLVGWWWVPATFLGRVTLWILLPPLGLWRSIRHGRKARDARLVRSLKS